MHTHLLTSGCSFSETVNFMSTPYGVVDESHFNGDVKAEFQKVLNQDHKKRYIHCGSWVPFLAIELDIPLNRTTNYAMGSQGNQMIARGIVHGVEELLSNGVPTKDILVGAQWSGISRGCVYSSDADPEYETNNLKGWMSNPVQLFTEQNSLMGWKIFNQHWITEGDHTDSNDYYKVFNELSTFAIETAERIHWVQEYLNGKGIDYFFTNMSQESSIFAEDVENITDNHVRKTIDLVDRSKFISVHEGIANWQTLYFKEPSWIGAHPSTYSSYMYVKDQILPYLANNHLIHA